MFIPNQTLTLTVDDWGGTFPESTNPRAKGLAIDAYVKRLVGSTALKYDTYDFEFPVLGTDITHHDIKSSSKASITISTDEFVKAKNLAADGFDLLYIIYRQHVERDAFCFLFAVTFNALQKSKLIRESNVSSGYYFFISSAEHLAVK